MKCDNNVNPSLALEFELEDAWSEAGVGEEGVLGVVLHVALRAPLRAQPLPLRQQERRSRRLGGGCFFPGEKSRWYFQT